MQSRYTQAIGDYIPSATADVGDFAIVGNRAVPVYKPEYVSAAGIRGFGTNGEAPPERGARYISTASSAVWGAASLVSMAACTYHGYKRNNSLGWAIGWGAVGALLPVISVVVAVAQGYGKPKKRR